LRLVPRRRRLLILAALALAAETACAVDLPVTDRTLGNGLRVLVHEDHSAPVVSSYVFYRSGSRNETNGQTGIAHLFEHMMFNGGKKFGPGMFDDLIEGNGGSTNGFTTKDLTAYLNNFPREALPLVLDLESDRMANLAITKSNLEQERGIVMEERRLRIDNQVVGAMTEALELEAFVRSPYRWNTCGFMEDLERITLDEARAYFRTYYAPNNAVLVLAGDVAPEPTFALAERYFGRIPRRAPPAPVDGREPLQEGPRRAVVHKAAELPAILMGWRGVRVGDQDRAVLDVLERLLGDGDSSRLELDLVREHEVATETSVDNSWTIDPELFTIYAQAAPGKTPEALEARIEAVLRDLAEKPVPADELAKAKTRLRADLVRSLKTVSGKANRIGFAEVVFGDYHAFGRVESEWEKVGPEDVRRVVGKYLGPEQKTVVTLDPIRPGGAKP
jgi:predicted Zn-dependent peptidase